MTKRGNIKTIAGFAASAFTAAVMVATPDWEAYKPVPAKLTTKVSVQPDAFPPPPVDETVLAAKRAFYFDGHGNKRGSLDFAWERAKMIAPDSQKWAYETAEHARQVGVHPLPLLLVMANETGLKDSYEGDKKDAQGPFQVQAAWFLDNVLAYAKDTPYYKELAPDSSQKLALDHILDDKNLQDAEIRKARAQKITDMFAADDKDSDPLDWQFSQLRLDRTFMGQLMALKMANDTPDYKIQNLPSDAEQAIEVIMGNFGKTYSEHLKGATGSMYLYALAEAAPDLRIADADKVQIVADKLQEENGWPYKFEAASWLSNTNDNPGPFKEGANTRLGDIPRHFIEYVTLKSSLVMETMAPVVLAASPIHGQTFSNYTSFGRDVLDDLNRDTTVTTSIRPIARPQFIQEVAEKTPIRPQPRPDRFRFIIASQ